MLPSTRFKVTKKQSSQRCPPWMNWGRISSANARSSNRFLDRITKSIKAWNSFPRRFLMVSSRLLPPRWEGLPSRVFTPWAHLGIGHDRLSTQPISYTSRAMEPPRNSSRSAMRLGSMAMVRSSSIPTTRCQQQPRPTAARDGRLGFAWCQPDCSQQRLLQCADSGYQ